MNRRTIVRGIQLIVGITLATFTWLLYASIREDSRNGHPADFAAGFAHLHPGWLLVAAVLALQEGVFGGLRIYVLGRVLSDELKVRTAIISEFVLMFCAGVTPLQAGAAPAQVAVLANGGMRLVDVATAELLTALCTATFFLSSLVMIFVLRANGQFVITDGPQLDWLLGLSVTIVGGSFISLVLCAAYPPLLKVIVRALAVPFGVLYRALLRLLTASTRLRAWATKNLEKRGVVRDRLLQSVDEFNRGFRIYLQRGKIDAIWMDAGATAVAAVEAFEDGGYDMPVFVGEDQQDFLQKWKELGLTAIAPAYPSYQWRTPIIAAVHTLKGEAVPSPEWILPQPAITQATLDSYINTDMPPLHYALCGCEDMPNYPAAWGGK